MTLFHMVEAEARISLQEFNQWGTSVLKLASSPCDHSRYITFLTRKDDWAGSTPRPDASPRPRLTFKTPASLSFANMFIDHGLARHTRLPSNWVPWNIGFSKNESRAEYET